MRVLITGSSGLIGKQVAGDLTALGHIIVPFDIERGDDIRDGKAVSKAAQHCDAVIHSAAMLGFADQADSDIFDVNVKGTWNVASAAAKAGVKRVVYLSSVNALGIFKGERQPDYFPIDDDHPKYPSTAYGVGKLICEEMCKTLSRASSMSSIALRPPVVWPPDQYKKMRAQFKENPERGPANWEYGAFIDVRDMASACIAALEAKIDGFEAMLVCAADICAAAPARDMATKLSPNAEWRGGPEFDTDPFHALVDCRKAHRALNWKPRYSWAGRGL